MRSLAIALCLMVCGARAHAIEIEWRARPFASEFWIIDQLSRWNPRQTSPLYEEAWKKRFELTREDRDLLARYAQIRAARSADPHEDDVDMKHPLRDGLIGPSPFKFETFALAFIDAENPKQASVALGLQPDEAKTIQAIFSRFHSRIQVLLANATFLQGGLEQLKAASEKAGMAAFLVKAAGFYGSVGVPPTLFVEILWAPEGYGRATAFDGHMIIPLAADEVKGPREALDAKVGTIVHELGHDLLSKVPIETKLALTDLAFERYGLPNRHHPNVLDEAIQTALGNILFVREKFPGDIEATRSLFYDYEPDNDFPYAIDILARDLEPILSVEMSKPGGFATTFFPQALEAQRRLFGELPRFHTRVALMLYGDRPTRSYFDGLFPGVSRTNFKVGELDRFRRGSRENPHVTRWIAVARPQLQGADGKGLRSEMPFISSLAERVDAHHANACTMAHRRGPMAGYDFAVVGRDDDAVRQMLIALHGHEGIPEAQPFCLAP